MTIEKCVERIEKHLGIDDEPEILTVIDPDTGLEWQAAGSSDQMDWEEAHDYCDSLNKDRFAGYSDWRIPTRVELYTLVVDAELNPCIKPLPGIKCKSDNYWSSITYAGSPSGAWSVGFGLGGVGGNSKTNSFYVRCVRGGNR